MLRSVFLALAIPALLGGCAHHRAGGMHTAYRRIDRAADAVGQVLYPPLAIVAFPLWFLSPGK